MQPQELLQFIYKITKIFGRNHWGGMDHFAFFWGPPGQIQMFHAAPKKIAASKELAFFRGLLNHFGAPVVPYAPRKRPVLAKIPHF